MSLFDKVEIPPMPQVVNKILEIDENNIELSFDELRTLISSDPGLVTKILKLANSPFYSRMNNITDLQQAISMLGFKSIKSLTLLVSISRLIPDQARNLEIQRELWMRSILRGVITKTIAQKLGQRAEQETAFMMALLRNIGQFVMQSRFPGIYDQMYAKADMGLDLESLHKQENETFGISSDRMSKLIMERWNFPAEFICIATVSIENPQKTESECGNKAAMVCFGEVILYLNRFTKHIPNLEKYQTHFKDLFNQYTDFFGMDDRQKDFFLNKVEGAFAADDLLAFCEELFS